MTASEAVYGVISTRIPQQCRAALSFPHVTEYFPAPAKPRLVDRLLCCGHLAAAASARTSLSLLTLWCP